VIEYDSMLINVKDGMNASKNKITVKLIISYALVLILSAFAFVLFYQQLIRFTETSNQSIDFNEHVFLISETITDLYEVESLGRNLIKNYDSIALRKYKFKISAINESIDQLVFKYSDTSQRTKINSIKDLLRRKNKNVNQLIEIYKKKNSESYYASAIKELKRVDETFKNYFYKNRFQNLEKHQRKYLINLLEYSKVDNEDKLSNKTVDSIAISVIDVLLKLSRKELSIQRAIEAKEDEIIENDRVLTSQIRSMLTALEYKELALYSQQNKETKKILSKTYKIILFSSGLTLLMALVFLYLINKDVRIGNAHKVALEKAKNYSEKLLKNRESLISMVTHDIRAPLNTIIGFLELLNNVEIQAKSQHYIVQMQKSSEYMLRLVNDLLDFSKAESGKLSTEFISFQPNLVIDNAIRQAIPAKGYKDLQYLIIIDEKLEELFVSDPYRIGQIAINLINNAYKFTNNGFIKINAELLYLKKKPYLKLNISDSGVGIPEEKKDRIFEAFSQDESIKSQGQNGFGLGLYITKNLVDLLEGELTVDTEVGKGSAFNCLIPLQQIEANKNPQNKITEFSTSISEISIVIVDDEKAQLVFLEAVFEQYKINCYSFQDSIKALDFIEANLPSLVITDIQMPTMDGFSFMDKLKKNSLTSKIPVIGLTGNSSFLKQNFIKAGFTHHLLKPYKPTELLHLISSTLYIEIKIKKEGSQQKENNLISNYFDLTDLVSFLDNDRGAVNKIIETFCESTQQQLLDWEIALLDKNKVELKYIAHKIQPMFLQFKANKVSGALKKISMDEIKDETDFYTCCASVKTKIVDTLNHLEYFIS